ALLDQTLVVIDERGRQFQRERAVSAVLGALPLGSLGLGLWLRVPGVAELARLAYDAVAQRRHVLSAYLGLGLCGVAAAPEIPSSSRPIRVGARRLWPALALDARVALREGFVVLALVMVALQLMLDNDWARRRVSVSQPLALQHVMDFFRLYQG